MISIQKRGKVYQYRFEAAKVNGKRNMGQIQISLPLLILLDSLKSLILLGF